MIKRQAESVLLDLSKGYPILAITGGQDHAGSIHLH